MSKMNIEKTAEIIKNTGTDALLLFDESNMHYLCGFSPSEGAVIINSDMSGYHIVDSRYTQNARSYAEKTGLTVIEIKNDFISEIKSIVKKHNISSVLFENLTISYAKYLQCTSQLEGVEFIPLNDSLMRLRNIKTADEIMMIKEANNIAEKSFLQLLDEVKPGKTEKELAALFDYLMAKNGSDSVSFDTILLAGEHTAMPHGVAQDREIQSGDFVLFDFGATKNGYHSDMTRTVAVSYATDEMIADYDIVRRAQLAGIKALEDDAACRDVYYAAYNVLKQGERAEYFRHSLGHGVGLDIHEGFNASPKSVDVYETGNVTSIEPGIYMPGKYGIRIEDLLYISPRGRENLSNITKELIILK